ncbi:MAG: MotA/TolQ/ExbB proton channel family protein [Desulfovibrio sp.]
MNPLAAQAAKLADYFASGGAVMWPLVGISIWAWTLVLLKGRQLAGWRRNEGPSREVIRRVLDERASGRTAPDTLSSGTGGNGSASWQTALAHEFLNRCTGDPVLDDRLLHRLSHRYGDRAQEHVGTILIFAAAAPLLGLLGTVTGMIGAFEALAAWGSAHPRALSGGISEALVSTQTGLLVAIPVLFAGQFLRRRAHTFQRRVDRFCAALARTVRNDPPAGNGRATTRKEEI